MRIVPLLVLAALLSACGGGGHSRPLTATVSDATTFGPGLPSHLPVVVETTRVLGVMPVYDVVYVVVYVENAGPTLSPK
jgi:hypothetical protein